MLLIPGCKCKASLTRNWISYSWFPECHQRQDSSAASWHFWEPSASSSVLQPLSKGSLHSCRDRTAGLMGRCLAWLGSISAFGIIVFVLKVSAGRRVLQWVRVVTGRDPALLTCNSDTLPQSSKTHSNNFTTSTVQAASAKASQAQAPCLYSCPVVCGWPARVKEFRISIHLSLYHNLWREICWVPPKWQLFYIWIWPWRSCFGSQRCAALAEEIEQFVLDNGLNDARVSSGVSSVVSIWWNVHFLAHHTLTAHSSLHNLRLQSSSACTARAYLKAQHVTWRNVRLMLCEVLAALCNDRSCIEINGNGCGLIDHHSGERERERERDGHSNMCEFCKYMGSNGRLQWVWQNWNGVGVNWKYQ